MFDSVTSVTQFELQFESETYLNFKHQYDPYSQYKEKDLLKIKNLYERVKLIDKTNRCRQLLGLALGQYGHFWIKRGNRDQANTIYNCVLILITLYL